MSWIYNDNTKRPNPKENQPGILEISTREFTHFAENSGKRPRSRRVLVGLNIYLWDYTEKVAVTLLPSASRKDTVEA